MHVFSYLIRVRSRVFLVPLLSAFFVLFFLLSLCFDFLLRCSSLLFFLLLFFLRVYCHSLFSFLFVVILLILLSYSSFYFFLYLHLRFHLFSFPLFSSFSLLLRPSCSFKYFPPSFWINYSLGLGFYKLSCYFCVSYFVPLLFFFHDVISDSEFFISLVQSLFIVWTELRPYLNISKQFNQLTLVGQVLYSSYWRSSLFVVGQCLVSR